MTTEPGLEQNLGLHLGGPISLNQSSGLRSNLQSDYIQSTMIQPRCDRLILLVILEKVGYGKDMFVLDFD